GAGRHDVAVDIEVLRPAEDLQQRLERLGEAEDLHDAHHLRVDADAAGQVGRGRRTVEHHGADALQTQEVGEDAAHRTDADDRDVEVRHEGGVAHRATAPFDTATPMPVIHSGTGS